MNAHMKTTTRFYLLCCETSRSTSVVAVVGLHTLKASSIRRRQQKQESVREEMKEKDALLRVVYTARTRTLLAVLRCAPPRRHQQLCPSLQHEMDNRTIDRGLLPQDYRWGHRFPSLRLRSGFLKSLYPISYAGLLAEITWWRYHYSAVIWLEKRGHKLCYMCYFSYLFNTYSMKDLLSLSCPACKFRFDSCFVWGFFGGWVLLCYCIYQVHCDARCCQVWRGLHAAPPPILFSFPFLLFPRCNDQIKASCGGFSIKARRCGG